MRSAIIAILLLAVATTPVFAAGFTVTRTQTVYSVLDWTGKRSEVSAVNWIRVEGNGLFTVIDRPELSEITPLDPSLKPIQNKGKTEWNIESDGTKDIFYIGKTTKALPVDVKVDLKLNGKNAKPEEVVGKAGEVSIGFTFTNNSPKKEWVSWSFGGVQKRELRTIYQPMTIMLQADMDVESFENTTAGGAFSMVVGGHKKLLWTLFPMPQGEASFSFTSKEVRLPSIQISVLPKSLNLPIPEIDPAMMDLVGLMGDDSEMFDLIGLKLDIDPKKSLAQMNRMQGLVDASKLAVQDSTTQLSAFTDAIGQMEKGLTELSDGASKLSELSKGHKQLLETMRETLKSNQDGLLAGVGAVESAHTSSSKVSRELFVTKTQLEDIAGAIAKLKPGITDQATLDALNEIEKSVNSTITKIDNVKSDSDKATTTLKTLVEGGTIGGKQVPALSEMPNNLTLLDQALTALIDGGEMMGVQMPGIQTTIDGLNQISAGLGTIIKGGNIGGQDFPPLTDVPKKLDEAMGQLKVLTNGGEFKGISVPSQSEVEEMMSSFKKSLEDLAPMKDKLDSFSKKLNKAIEDAGGVEKIKEAASDIEESIVIKKAEYDKMTELGESYTSFVGQTEGAGSSVLFVMKLKEFDTPQKQAIKSSNTNKTDNPYSNINKYKYLILIISGLCIILAFVLNMIFKRRYSHL